MAPPLAAAAAAVPYTSIRRFHVEARRNTKTPRKPRNARTLRSSSSSTSGSGSSGGAATTFTRLPVRDSPATASRELTLEQFPIAPNMPEPKAPAFARKNVEHLEDEEELDYDGGAATTFARLPLRNSPTTSGVATIGKFDSFPTKKSTKGRAFVPQELEEEEEYDDYDEEEEEAVVFDPGYDRRSDGKQFDTFPIKRSTKGRAFPIKELELLEEDDEDDEFDPDYDGDSDDEEVLVGSELEADEADDEEDGDVKEKRVPAVMRCFDTARIYAKAGDGGNGVVAFRREKYVPYGGPSGGDGGRGGNVYVEVDGEMNSLLPFRKSVHFRAGRGRHGQGKEQAGAKGEDVVVKVPPGTVVRAVAGGRCDGVELLELMRPGQRAMILPGGRGGRGNAAFKSGTNKVPKIAEKGEQGAEMWIDLELKLVADVGIVGAPNAGKSTLLSAISAAKPTIASYPFTTLLPNLGVVSLDFDATMVVADLPGLLEGAHRGYGLGHEFLRHSKRCSVLVHVVDGSGQQPEYEFEAVRLELELFSPSLVDKPYIVVFNKMDLPEAHERWDLFREKLQVQGIEPYCISALTRQGTQDVASAAYRILQKERQRTKGTEEWSGPENLNHVADAIRRERSTSMNEFEIFHDSDSDTWKVVGAGIERFVQMTNWQYTESLKRFQHVLEACGVNKSLIKSGVKEGDTVIVADMEMIWNDEPGKTAPSDTKKRTDDVKWPQFG